MNLSHRNLLLSPDAATEGAPANAAPGTVIDQPDVDFVATDNISFTPVMPVNGTHLCKLAAFEPAMDQTTGLVQRWVFTLDAAEEIADNQTPSDKIHEGSRLGTFSVFMAPSPFTDIKECVTIAFKVSLALNEIVLDLRNDPQGKLAKAAWMALPPVSRHPFFAGQPVMLSSKLEYYQQHVGKLLLVTFNTKVSKTTGMPNTRLTGFLAPRSPRALKK